MGSCVLDGMVGCLGVVNLGCGVVWKVLVSSCKKYWKKMRCQ
jgi:hypothetical protein